eukprot:jgi/Tetstr1/443782/TSEL_031770.t1
MCVVSALSDLVVWRIHMQMNHPLTPNKNEAMPDFKDKASWYKNPLLKGNDPQWAKDGITDPKDAKYRIHAGIHYDAQHSILERLFSILGIESDKITHASRGVAARRLRLLSNGNSGMVAGRGHWAQDGEGGNSVMSECYLTDIDVAAEAYMAGFDQPGHYRLPRAQLEVPQACLEKIFPGIEKEVEDLKSKINTPEADHSALGFATTLMRLREVFIQDSVEKMEHMPDHPLWDMDVFKMDEYKEYKAQLQEHLERTRATIVPPTVKEFAPQVADALAGVNDNVSALRATNAKAVATLAEHMGRIEEKLDDAIAGAGAVAEVPG